MYLSVGAAYRFALCSNRWASPSCSATRLELIWHWIFRTFPVSIYQYHSSIGNLLQVIVAIRNDIVIFLQDVCLLLEPNILLGSIVTASGIPVWMNLSW